MKYGVYARDTYSDEMFGETGNYCYTDYTAKFLPNGNIDLETLYTAMIDKGWLDSYTSIKDFKIVEKENRYNIFIYEESYQANEPDFYIDKEDY